MPHLNLTVANILFALSSLVGLIFSLAILPSYIKAYRGARRVADPEERALAKGLHFEIMFGEINRCALHFLFLVLAIWSMAFPPLPKSVVPWWVTLYSDYFIFTLFFANVGLTINTLIVRHGYLRRRGKGIPIKVLPTRDSAARMWRRIRRLERRADADEVRNKTSEERADRAHERADGVDVQQVVQDDRLNVTEDVLEIKRTIKTVEKKEEE